MSIYSLREPKEKQFNLQGYHRVMIPHVAFIIDFDRAHEFYKDFQALTPTDTESFERYKKGHLRYYTCKIDICPNDIIEVKSLIDLANHASYAETNAQLYKFITNKYYKVIDDYSLIQLTKNEMMQALKDKINEP